MAVDTLANLLSNMVNAVKSGKVKCLAKPSSTLAGTVLSLLKDCGYVSGFEVVRDTRGGVIHVELKGKLNRCGAIKPRFAVQQDEYVKYEKRYLPARGFGVLIVSTTKGIMTHEEAKEKGLGGRLIAYAY